MKPPSGVFVYGSLLPGERYRAVLEALGPLVAVPARLRGWRLFVLPEGYPAAVPGSGILEGELVEFFDLERALRALDAFEGSDGLYRRRALDVETPAGMRRAWAYVAEAASVVRHGGVPWPSGRWRGRRA